MSYAGTYVHIAAKSYHVTVFGSLIRTCIHMGHSQKRCSNTHTRVPTLAQRTHTNMMHDAWVVYTLAWILMAPLKEFNHSSKTRKT